ncbi:MAG: hypothetical protein LBQ88_08200 [Treponema sp.]|jgi:hypothetical protein|nr:hypothetical protein [Treponema sp.]
MEAEMERPETFEPSQSEAPEFSDIVPEQPEFSNSSQNEAPVFVDTVREQYESPEFSQNEAPVFLDAAAEQPESSNSSQNEAPAFVDTGTEQPESSPCKIPEFLQETQEEFLASHFEYEKCLSVLLREKELLGEITSMQAQVRQAVIDREWTDFDSMLNILNSLGDEFQTLESDRVELFKAALDGNDEGTDFYGMIVQLQPEQRSKITEVYRNLKMEFFKVRMANDTLTTYLNEAKTVVTSFLEAAFPERRNHVYSRSGVPIPQDMRSLIVNQSF